MKLMVYSHDTFGLGNIRRMLAICQHLIDSMQGISILLVSGSPVMHRLHLPQGIDYIKLPCLGRDQSGKLSPTSLGTKTDEAVRLRSDLITAAAVNFQPDLFLVDKKPYGLEGELKDTLGYLKTGLPQTKLVLLLRDILDTPETTINNWRNNNYYRAIESYYDRVLVVGIPEIFDLVKEYQFPQKVSQKVRFCGYIHRKPGRKGGKVLRQELQIKPEEKLVLVTPGGGADGYFLLDTYLSTLSLQHSEDNIKSLIVSGPEMPQSQRERLTRAVHQYPQVEICEYTDDLASYMEAANTIVAMGGYNTVCEILSLDKQAVIVPRTKPVQEQLIRAQRMASFGLFRAIHPDFLTPEILLEAILEQLKGKSDRCLDARTWVEPNRFADTHVYCQGEVLCASTECHYLPLASTVDMNGLPRIQQELSQLLLNQDDTKNLSTYIDSFDRQSLFAA